MQVFTGRPDNLTNLQKKEIRVYDFLDSLNIKYIRVEHEAAMTMEACADVDIALGAQMCKNLLLCNRQNTIFYLLMLPGDKPFKTKELSAQIGSSRLSFASGEYMEKFLDITPGSLSVMGLMNDKENRVQLLIDNDQLTGKFVGCHPCVNTASLRLSVKERIDTILPAMNHAPIFVTLSGEVS